MIYAISALINAILTSLLGFLVYKNNPDRVINKKYSLFCLVVAFWSYGYFFWQISTNAVSALFWVRFFMAGAIFIPLSFFHFTLLFLNIYNKKNLIQVGTGFFAICFFLNFTPLFVKNVTSKLGFRFWPEPGILFAPFLLVWLFYCIYPCVLLFREHRKSSGIKQNQIKYVLLGILVGYTSGSTNYFLWYDIPIPPYGNFIVPLFVGLMAYAIVKHRLMDIRVAVTRGMVFGVVYILILGIPFGTAILGEEYLSNNIGDRWWLLPVFFSVIIASLGPGIYSKLKNKAEWALFRQQKEYQHTLVELGKRMTLTKNINDLLTWITRTVTTNVGVSYTRIFLWDDEKKEYEYRKGYGLERRQQHDIRLDEESPLIKHLKKVKEPVLKEELLNEFKIKKTEQYNEAEKYIRNTGAELIVPAFIKERMNGFMTLGTKNNGRIYTPEDIDMFRILAGQAALAIENAEFYNKVKQSEAMLVQAAKMSSIGQMAAGFAHNINNPFCGIQLNAQMLSSFIDGENSISDEKRSKMRNALELIMGNAEKGSGIVDSIMRFSKPGTGKKRIAEMREIISESLKLAESKIKGGRVEVNTDIEEGINILGEDVQLEQVFMNILTNAVDSVVENGREKKIFIKAVRDKKKNAVVEIIDTGHGLSKDVVGQVFDYFFTTKRNAGTGLGLALSYQIINSHGGSITAANSKDGGAVFTVTLPLA